jgi:hypothetical protein
MSSAQFPSVPDSTSENIVKEWLDIIKRQECGIISFPPRGGAYRRIEHLLGWNQLLKKYLGNSYKQYLLYDISAFDLTHISISDLAGTLLEQINIKSETVNKPQDFILATMPLLKQNQSLSFFIYETDDWFTNSRIDIMTFLSKICQLEPRIQFLLFCEIDIASPKIIKLNLGATTLTQNILTVPIYNHDDILYFITQLAKHWQVDISLKDAKKIIDKVGTHVWITKEAVRIYLKLGKIPNTFINFPTIQLKLETIWQQFSSPEQQILSKITSNQTLTKFDLGSSFNHLESIGIITTKNYSYSLTLPVFFEFIKQKNLTRNL